eukprot:gene44136-51275_t
MAQRSGWGDSASKGGSAPASLRFEGVVNEWNPPPKGYGATPRPHSLRACCS